MTPCDLLSAPTVRTASAGAITQRIGLSGANFVICR